LCRPRCRRGMGVVEGDGDNRREGMRPDRFDNESGSRPVRAIRRLLWFLGATAVFWGIAMVFRIGPGDFLPIEWLDPVPLVNSWTVPGLVLFLFFGVGSLAVVWLSRPGRPGPPRRGHLHWSWVAPIVIGGCLTIWIL